MTTPSIDAAVPRPPSPQPVDPRVFVLGATGYVGGEVVRQLSARDGITQVLAHVRPDSPRAEAARTTLGDLPRVVLDRSPLEVTALRATIERAASTHVFLCHGTTRKRARAEGLEDPYETVDVGLVDLVCRAASDIEAPPRLVHLSSVGANPNTRSAYLAARGRAEKLLQDSGLPHTICRAPLLAGPDREESRPLETLARWIANPLLRAAGAIGLGRLRDQYLSMNAKEAAEGLIRSGFHYMTIDRVVRSDELRRVGVYERENWTPASRRDAARH